MHPYYWNTALYSLGCVYLRKYSILTYGIAWKWPKMHSVNSVQLIYLSLSSLSLYLSLSVSHCASMILLMTKT